MTQKAEFCKSDIVKVDMNRIERIKCMVEKDGICRRYRLCMHDSPDNALQEMFICRHIGDYCRPDKHFNIPESHTIIEGSEAIILFDDFGGILDLFILDRSDGYLSYRIDNGVYHMTVPLTECAVDLEVKLGPFKSKNNIFPKWAPEAGDEPAVQAFLETVMEKIREMQSFDYKGRKEE